MEAWNGDVVEMWSDGMVGVWDNNGYVGALFFVFFSSARENRTFLRARFFLSWLVC